MIMRKKRDREHGKKWHKTIRTKSLIVYDLLFLFRRCRTMVGCHRLFSKFNWIKFESNFIEVSSLRKNRNSLCSRLTRAMPYVCAKERKRERKRREMNFENFPLTHWHSVPFNHTEKWNQKIFSHEFTWKTVLSRKNPIDFQHKSNNSRIY